MSVVQTLGLVDHHYRTAHNVTIVFVDGTVMTNINKTLKWLESNIYENYYQIISKDESTQMHEVNIAKEQDMRLVEKKIRQKIADLKENFKRRCRMLLMAMHDGFPELQDNQRSTISAIVTTPAIISGHHFEHMWFVNNQNVLYHVHVVSVKCSKR